MHACYFPFNMTPLPNGQFTNVSSKNRLRIFSRIQMVANIFSWLCQKHFFFSQQDLWMMARLARDMYHAYRVKEKYWASYINLSIQCWRNLLYKIQIWGTSKLNILVIKIQFWQNFTFSTFRHFCCQNSKLFLNCF